MQKIAAVGLIAIGVAAGTFFSNNLGSPAIAQMGPSTQGGGDALWHLPKFGEQGWFIHAHNGKIRACNMDKASIVGERPGPRCSNWE
jgi:hypothetical protein